jgi:hypothetical protein
MALMRIRFTRIPTDILTTKLGGAGEGEMEIRLIPYDPRRASKRGGRASPGTA